MENAFSRAIIVFVGLLPLFVRTLPATRNVGFKVCRTPECERAAKEVLSCIQPSVDPCTDFYQYACGGWIAKNPIPPTESHWNQFNMLNEEVTAAVRDILEAPKTPSNPPLLNTAKSMYKKCVDVDELEGLEYKPLLARLNKFNGWPMLEKWYDPEIDFEQDKFLAYLMRHLDVSPLFQIYVGVDRKDTNRHVITIDQPSVVLPRLMMVTPKAYRAQIKAYKKWILDMASELVYHCNVADDQLEVIENLPENVDELVGFETELAKILSPPELRRQGERMYNPMTLKQLQALTDSAGAIGHIKFDWTYLVRKVLGDDTIKSSERVIVKEVDYMVELVKLLELININTIGDYCFWRMAKLLATEMTPDFRRFTFEFDQVLSGIQEEQPRWKDCIHFTSSALSFVVGHEYVQKHFDHEAKESALKIVENVKSAYIEQMANVTWMDRRTRMAAVGKLEAMTRHIGYPNWFGNRTHMEEYYRDFKLHSHHHDNIEGIRTFNRIKNSMKLREPVDREEWEISPAIVNAFYSPLMNLITFPAGILQTPFFSKGRPEALNYGSIGVVIGHEMSHGFDDNGRQFDKLGNLAQWWSNETLRRYLKKTECFIEQYGNYTIPELSGFLGRTVKLNGKLTLGENMADNGGLHQSHSAYRALSRAKGFEELRLPGLEGFTPDQLFFIGFATNWCETTTDESLLREVLSDPHSPHKFRIQGMVSNSPAFAEAFGCAPGSPMNPQHKCHFW